MFWLLHGKTKTRLVPGGQTLHDTCPACGEHAAFHEVEVTTAAGAFFVDVVSGTDRGFRCSNCAEVMDLRDDDAAAAPPAPPPPRDLLAVLEAEREARIIADAKRDLAVEDELAALKRKLGKN